VDVPEEAIFWLRGLDRVSLQASWEPQARRGVRALLKRLRRHQPSVGWLGVDAWVLQLKLHYVSELLEVALDAPLVAHVSRAAGDGGEQGCEVNLGVRNVDAPLGTSWLQVRSVWPMQHVGDDVPEKHENAPFISPHHFRRLCGAIQALVEVNGGQWRGEIELDVDALVLEQLRSRTSAVCCVSCQSPHIVAIASEAYRCGECGYEGGSGLPAFLLELELRDYRQQSEAVQRSRVLFHIEEILAALRTALAYWIPEGGIDQVRIERLRVQRHLMAVQLHLVKLSHKHVEVQAQAQAHATEVKRWVMAVRRLDPSVQRHIRHLRDDLRAWRFEVEVRQAQASADPVALGWGDAAARAGELLEQAKSLLETAVICRGRVYPEACRQVHEALVEVRRVVAEGARHVSTSRIASMARDVAQVEALEAHYRLTRKFYDEHLTVLQTLRERLQQA